MTKITITEVEAATVAKLATRYWFGMFQAAGIARNEEEEYLMRDAIISLSERISETTRCNTTGSRKGGATPPLTPNKGQ